MIAIGNNVDRGMMEGLSEDKHSGRHCIWNYDDWIDFGEALGQKIQKIKN